MSLTRTRVPTEFMRYVVNDLQLANTHFVLHGMHHDLPVWIHTRGVELVGVETEREVGQQRTAAHVAVHVTHFRVALFGAVFNRLHLPWQIYRRGHIPLVDVVYLNVVVLACECDACAFVVERGTCQPNTQTLLLEWIGTVEVMQLKLPIQWGGYQLILIEPNCCDIERVPT